MYNVIQRSCKCNVYIYATYIKRNSGKGGGTQKKQLVGVCYWLQWVYSFTSWYSWHYSTENLEQSENIFPYSYIINSSNANTEKAVHLGDLKYLMKCNNSEYMIIYVIYSYTCWLEKELESFTSLCLLYKRIMLLTSMIAHW